jgi:YHS domain-containing protein
MAIDPKTSPALSYHGKTYRFCVPAHGRILASAPERFIDA